MWAKCVQAMKHQSPLWGLNPRPYAYGAYALPAELKRHFLVWHSQEYVARDRKQTGTPHVSVHGTAVDHDLSMGIAGIVGFAA